MTPQEFYHSPITICQQFSFRNVVKFLGGHKSQNSCTDSIFVVGDNKFGQLCLNHTEIVNELVSWNTYNKNEAINVKSIHSYGFTIITTNDNRFICAGDN